MYYVLRQEREFISLKSMLKAHGLRYAYPDGKELQFPDIELPDGEEWLILGPSGCGKTTLLHLVAGLIRPQSGDVEMNNVSFKGLSGTSLDKLRGRKIGIIFQVPHFIQSLSVEKNLMLAQHLAGVKQDRSKVHEVLGRLGLGEKARSKPRNLSSGEQQRVSIARALLNEPEIILADEPTSALDDHNCEEVLKLLREQAGKVNATLVIVTHDNRLKDKIKNRIEL